jgi:hypothetical protein
MTKPFNWSKSCSHDEPQKASFHRIAKRRLKDLATLLGWHPGTFDLRNNKAGIAVSGEITLHHDAVYVQVSQFAAGGRNGILIRSCNGRKDYHGGRNTFADLALLDDLPTLATRVQAQMRQPHMGDAA